MNNNNNGKKYNRVNATYTSVNKPWSPKPERPNNASNTSKPKKYGNPFEVETKSAEVKNLRGTTRTTPYTGFMNALKDNVFDTYDNVSYTENGAKGFATTKHPILDMNFAIAGLRSADEKQILEYFRNAYKENPILAMRFLYYVGDIKEGLGERKIFNTVLKDLAKNEPKMIRALVSLSATDMRRFDDIYSLISVPGMKSAVQNFIINQWNSDVENMKAGKPISLLAKWLKSTNTSSEQSRKYGGMTRKMLGLSTREYTTALSTMRKYIDVVERKMSSNNWQAIDYERVPSKANLIYNNAFLKHDEERRRAYLGALSKGEAKINASVLMPHEIVNKYVDSNGWERHLKAYDETLEQLWKNLPDLVQGNGTTICVADGSESMTSRINGTKVSCLDVANALAIYFAERCSGPFKNTYITFSRHPKLVDMSSCETLRDKIRTALQHNEVANTNIEAVFDLLLDTAVKNHLSQEDIPANVLILSDCEFDAQVDISGCYFDRGMNYSNHHQYYTNATARLFEVITKRWEDAGYKLPRLIFWHINARVQKTVPITQNDAGVILVSGFSVNTLKMVMNQEVDPWKALVKTVMNKRYDIVIDSIRNVYEIKSETTKKVLKSKDNIPAITKKVVTVPKARVRRASKKTNK